MWIQLSPTKYAQASDTAMQVVDVAELQAKLTTLQTKFTGAQAAYDARVALITSEQNPEIKLVLQESLEILYAPILTTQEEIAKLDAIYYDIYGVHI